MNKQEFRSQVKKRFEYQEARLAEGDPTDPNSPNYNFAAKFRRNREASVGQKSATSDPAQSVKEALEVKESLIVEKDPNQVKLVFHKPPSVAYKAFVKSYLVDTQNLCVTLLSVLLIAGCVALGAFLHVTSASVTEFVVDYGTL